MADPLSAIGAAAAILDLSEAAWKAGNYLYRVYQGSKTVNEEIKTLALEVNALASACDLIHEELEEIIKTPSANGKGPQYDQDGRLAKCVERQTADCEDTLKELWAVVEALWPRGQRFLDNASRQIKLQNSKERLDAIRNRIQSHTSALQMILSVVNVKVAHLAPGQATRHLPDMLEDLQVRLQRMELKLDKQAAQGISVGDSDATLVGCAHDALRSGISLYEASVTGGSVRGADDAANSNLMVAEWLAKLNALRIDNRKSMISEGDSHAPTVFSDDGKLDATTELSSNLDRADVEDDADEYDSEDELAEVASTAIKDGSSAFRDEDWTEAHALLQESVDLLELLPHKHRTKVDLFELQFQLATCTYHLKPPADAEPVLQTLLQHPAETDAQSIQLCNARHLLAQCYIRLNKLDMAKDACEATLHARSRLLGKQHDARYASLALMSHIYGRLGNPTRAKIYASMIPEATRANLLAATHVAETSKDHEDKILMATDQCPPGNVASTVAPLTSAPDQVSVSAGDNNIARRRSVPLSASRSPKPRLVSKMTKEVQTDIPKLSLSTSSLPFEATQTISAGPMPNSTEIERSQKRQKSMGTASANAKMPSAEGTNSLRPTPAGEAGLSTELGRPESIPPSQQSDYLDIQPSSIRSLPVFAPTYKGDVKPADFWPGPVNAATRQILLRDNAPKLLADMNEFDRLICSGKQELFLSVLNTSTPTPESEPAAEPITRRSDGNRSLALHLAVLFGDEMLIQPLLDRGHKCWWWRPYSQPVYHDFERLTPLELAIACGRKSMIAAFINTADFLVNPRNWIWSWLLAPPIFIHIPSIKTREMAAIMKVVPSPSRGYNALSKPEAFLVQAITEPGLKKESRAIIVEFLLRSCDADQLAVTGPRSALHLAIDLNSLELVELLLQNSRYRGTQKKVLSAQDPQKYDPLYTAVRRACLDKALPLDIVRSLCDAGAPVMAIRRVSESRFLRSSKVTVSTPWSHAVNSGRTELVELLRARKPSNWGRPVSTPLRAAASIPGLP